MSITIALADGADVDFSSYLDDYAANFSQGYWGFFNDPGAGAFKGSEYAFSESTSTSTPIGSGNQSVIVDAGSGTFEYNINTHVLEGQVDSVTFGDGLSYNSGSDSFSSAADVEISGLGLSGTGSGNEVHDFVYDLMQGNTTELENELDNGVTYLSSTGDDTMLGYGGDDVFEFATGSGIDTVENFVQNEDLLDVSGWGAGDLGDLTIVESGGDSTVVSGSDAVTVEGVTGLSASDFVFA